MLPGQLTPSVSHTVWHYDQHIKQGESWPGATPQELAGHQLTSHDELAFICMTSLF